MITKEKLDVCVIVLYIYGNRTRFITGKTKRFSIFLLWKLDFLFINFLSNPPKKNEKRNSYENKEKQCVLFLIYFLLFYLNFLLFCYGWSFVRCMPHTELWKKWKNLADFVVFVVVVVWFVVVSITEGANHFARVCLITELALVRLIVTKVNFIFHSFEEKKKQHWKPHKNTNQQKECRTNRCSYERNARTLSTTHRHEHAH